MPQVLPRTSFKVHAQVAETLPQDVLERMHAPPKSDDPIVDAHALPEADAFVFG